MPSLNQALNADLSSYEPVTPTPSAPGAAGPQDDMQPGRSSVLRCPLPPVWQASPDSLRQFYLKGQVPQNRFLTPPAFQPNSAGGTTTTNASVIISGGGSSGGGSTTSLAAKQASLTTPSLGPNNKFSGSINLAKSFQLLSVAVGSPCRIQLYGTSAAQLSDINRGLDQPPAAGTGQNIICDVALDTVPYQWSFQSRTGANADNPQVASIYVTITNLDSTSDVVTMTLVYVPLEN